MKKYALHTNNGLVKLLAQSNEAAFAEIYDRYWQKLFAIAYNRFADNEVAEDVVHDVLLSLWQGRLHIKINQLENYLATATKYAVFNKIKKKTCEKKYVLDNSSKEKEEQNPCDISLHYRLILEKVNSEIERLPTNCRLIFKCRKELGMPVKEIAEIFHISTKTVENQITKASNRIKSLASGNGFLTLLTAILLLKSFF